MSYYYDLQPDSSDDEAPVDLATFKSGAVPEKTLSLSQPPASTEPTVQQSVIIASEGGDDNDDDVIEVSTSRSGQSHKKPLQGSRSPDFAGAGFTSINRSSTMSGQTAIPGPPVESTIDGLQAGEDEPDAIPQHRNVKPVVVIPRVEIDDEDILDLTAGGDIVKRVLKERSDEDGTFVYKVQFGDWTVEELSFDQLIELKNGQEALDVFGSEETPEETPESEVKPERMSSTRRGARRTQANASGAGFVSTVEAVPYSDDDAGSEEGVITRTRGIRRREPDQTQYEDIEEREDDDDDDDESGQDVGRRPGLRNGLRNGSTQAGRTLRSARRTSELQELEDGDDLPFLESDLPGARKRKRGLRTRGQTEADFIDDGIGFAKSKRQRMGERQSARATRHQGGMQEIDVDDIFRSDSDEGIHAAPKPKISATKEVFKTLPRDNEFRMRHNQECETCGQGSNVGQLIYCQGCTLTYHKSCLGNRSTREHLVTKVEDGEFVLQCRRCVGFARKKDATAPDQGKCQDCHQHGRACRAFRPRKTTAQEQKDRDENDGQDPNYEVHQSRLNNASNVLFRCFCCWRAFHFEHLPSRSDLMDTEVDADQRFREYSRDWKCKDCANMPAKVSGLIAWKPVDEDNYDPALPFDEIDEDEKAYLIKWEGMSYFRASWLPGAWVWGVTAASMRKAFGKRPEAQHPKMRTEDAIPEDYLRADIVLDIRYTSIVDIRTEEVDKARIREVDKALIKYKGLGYEDAVWEAPPSPDDGDRWTDFVTAYNDWVLGRYVRPPKAATMKSRLEKARANKEFSQLEKKAQPENVVGGELMKYQIEGLNWLYYKWFTLNNAVLADEMGLGKTIQIIGFLATLVHDWNCFPFLVVVPNSTCPNWRREIQRWAPSLRTVAYYGSKESRDSAYRCELFPEGSKDIRCHVVITSYDAAGDDNCRKFFRGVTWQGLIVDEGQRLKNEKTLLYAALGALKAPFRILLTGTPLQNNTRELFNLLHFLDDSHNASELEEQFQDLDQEKIKALHDMIRPYFLRRTKAQVLTFLPPMAQIIVPVSMTLVQKKVYRTILAKNPDLMKAIFSSGSVLKQNERGSLNNILMQLRKCLCHPFVYSKSIEERNVSISATHRNLVDASSKLQFLELLLPKLQEKGHRVLIFSQFLEMLDIVEDFLDGMSMRYQRLDGSISAMKKQKRIDEFNALDSPLFAFLLSTRAGGVGINLASADTVIILDPDFNPHQDIQALSRAHRIGQNKKVLCFQLVTRASAEERIMQMGRKKLALDHVIIQEMDAVDAEENDLVSVLRHGAGEIFQDHGERDITYDDASVDRLLDRSAMENTPATEEKSAETQFSFARVWSNNSASLQDAAPLEDMAEDQAPDPGVWANILKERERAAAEEARLKAEVFGRGRRVRGNIDYAGYKPADGVEGAEFAPVVEKRAKDGDESDTDFQAGATEDDEPYDGEDAFEKGELEDVGVGGTKRDAGKNKHGKQSPKQNPPPIPVATPKRGQKLVLAKASSTTPNKPKPKAVSKPKVVPKVSAPSVKRPNGAPGKKVVTPKKSVTGAAKASAPTLKKLGPPKQNTITKEPKTRPKISPATVEESEDSASRTPSPPASNTLQDPALFTKNVGEVSEGSSDPSKDVETARIESNTPCVQVETLVNLAISDRDEVVERKHPGFRRAPLPQTQESSPYGLPTPPEATTPHEATPAPPNTLFCLACRTRHAAGSCPLKLAGVEYCNLCGMAHFGMARVCPHIQSETQVRIMLEALKSSNEPQHLVNEARRYLRGLKGNLVQMKRQKELKEAVAREAQVQAQYQAARAPVWEA